MVSRVPIWRVRATSTWNYEKAQRFAQEPQRKPIHVTVENPMGFHDIIDGHHRWVAALLRGDSTISVVY